jgi:(p)ppGpp synthase/HD superfamily hydrolase
MIRHPAAKSKPHFIEKSAKPCTIKKIIKNKNREIKMMAIKQFSAATTRHRTADDAMALATYLHAGQTDHQGAPYIEHIHSVKDNYLKIRPSATEAEVMGMTLHDAVEDTIATLDDLVAWGYPDEAIMIVSNLTKSPYDERSYDEIMDELIATGHMPSIEGKIADTMHHLHPQRVARLKIVNQEKAERLGKRYHASLIKLCAAANKDYAMVMELIENSPPINASTNPTLENFTIR